MDFEALKYLFSNNDDMRSRAQNSVLKSMDNPEFLNVLINSLSSLIQEQPSAENFNLIQNICIVLHQEFKSKLNDSSFFSKEQVYFAYISLFQIVFMLPVQLRHYIIDTFEILFSDFNEINYFELINNCLSLLQQSSNIEDMTTALNLVYIWSSRQTLVGISENKLQHEEFTEKIIQILSPLLKQNLAFLASLPSEFLQYIQNSQSLQFASLFKNDENAMKEVNEKLKLIDMNIQFIEYSSNIIKPLYRMDKVLINEFNEIIIVFANVLCLDIQGSKSMIKTKISICELFSYIVKMFRPQFLAEYKKSFLQNFIVEIGPVIVKSILNSFLVCKDSNLLLELLHVIRVYIEDQIYLDIILTEDFITKILIPASFLTDDDLLTFSEIPEQYISFCMILDKDECRENNSIRKRITLIVELFKSEYKDLLLKFLCLPSSSPIEAEAKIFLKTVLIFFSKKIANSINIIQETINEIKAQATQVPPFYYSSLLALLSSLEPSDDIYKDNVAILKDCIEIAVLSLLNFESQVVRFAACDLLKCCIDCNCNHDMRSIYNSMIPIPQVIEALLYLTTSVQHQTIGLVIEKLFYLFPDFFLPVAIQVICQFFQIWKSNQSDDNCHQISSLLNCISRIIEELPNNCDAICQLLVILTPEILNSLQNIKSVYQSGAVQLINILGCLSDKIDQPPPEFYEMIFSMIINVGFNQKYFESIERSSPDDSDDEDDANFIYNNVTNLIEDYTVVIFSLICRKNFFFVGNTVNYVTKIIEALFAVKNDIKLNSSGILITICLIQSVAVTARSIPENSSNSLDSNQFIPLALPSVQFLRSFNVSQQKDDYDQIYNKELFILSVAVISSALIVNEQMAIQMLDPQILEIWVNNQWLCQHSSKIQFIHWTTIAFLIMAKYDLNQQGGLLFKMAVEQFLFIKTMDQDDDYNDLDEDDDLLQFKISGFPFDNLTCEQQFKDIDPNDQRLRFLSEDQLDSLYKYIH